MLWLACCSPSTPAIRTACWRLFLMNSVGEWRLVRSLDVTTRKSIQTDVNAWRPNGPSFEFVTQDACSREARLVG